MRALLVSLAALSMAVARPAAAGVEFFGTAKVKPSFFGNFDFDSGKADRPTLTEGGWVAGQFTRAELRLGWQAAGDKWKVYMLTEADLIMDKDTGDRSFYVGSVKNGQPNAGSEFGIERAQFSYSFLPELQLATGWDIRQLDIATGGMAFGDDHPFIEFNGRIGSDFRYEVTYLIIQNRTNDPGLPSSWTFNSWRAYYAKAYQTFAGDSWRLVLSPFVLASDNVAKAARAYYYGAELTGNVGMVKPYLEVVAVEGSFNRTRDVTATPATDIRSLAGFAGLEVALHKALSPYAAFRYTQGDGDRSDSTAKGFVGITDIGRFTGLLGMDGNILGEHLSSGASIYNSPLYSFSPDRAVGGNVYGGIGNASSGNNPGQQLFAVGAKGDLSDLVPNVSYKAQLFYILYDNTGNLVNVVDATRPVDKTVGTEVDVQVKYAFSNNFAIDYIGSVLLPGKGIKDQVNASTPAQAHTLTLAWTY